MSADSETLADLVRQIEEIKRRLRPLETGEQPGFSQGTWTAAFACSTSGTITINNSYKTGRYVKVGQAVHITGYFEAQSVASPVGVLQVTGLPFAVGPSTEYIGAFAVFPNGFAAGATPFIIARPSTNGTTINIYTFVSGAIGSSLANATQAGSGIFISGVYMAAA